MKPVSPQTTALGVLALAFLTGIAGGCLLSVQGGAEADSAVRGYLSSVAGNPVAPPSVARALLDTVMYPAACFLFGLTVPGVLLIPLTVAARGFFLSYAVASCVRVFGSLNGVLFSASLVGLPLLLCLPCLFLLASHGLLGSWALFRSSAKKSLLTYSLFNKKSFARFGISIGVLTVAAVVEMYICPFLVNAVAGKMV